MVLNAAPPKDVISTTIPVEKPITHEKAVAEVTKVTSVISYKATTEYDNLKKKWKNAVSTATENARIKFRQHNVYMWEKGSLEDIIYPYQEICILLYTGYKGKHADPDTAQKWVGQKKEGLHDNWKNLPFLTVVETVKKLLPTDDLLDFCKYLSGDTKCDTCNK